MAQTVKAQLVAGTFSRAPDAPALMRLGFAQARRDEEVGELVGERCDSSALGNDPKSAGMHWRSRIVSALHGKQVFAQRLGEWDQQLLAGLARNQPDLIPYEIDLRPSNGCQIGKGARPAG